jgi:cell division protein FtsB
MSADRKSKFRSWSWITIGSLLFLIFLAIATVRQSYQGWKVDQEIKQLDAQANALEGRNRHLAELAQSLQSPDSMDLEARKRLNVREPGEHVVVLQGFSASGSWDSSLDVSNAIPAKEPEPLASNPQRWFAYFFQK